MRILKTRASPQSKPGTNCKPHYRRNSSLVLAAALSALQAKWAQGQATATWNGGIGDWNTASSWSSGKVPNSGTTQVFIDGGNAANSIVNFGTSAQVLSLSVDAGDVLKFGSFRTLTIAGGGATVNGTIDLSGGSDLLTFQSTNTQTISGLGQITFGSQLPSSSLTASTVTPNNQLVIGPGILVHGGNGVLSAAPPGLISQGTVSADVNGRFIHIQGRATNAGTWQAINGGTLDIQASQWDNRGTIVVDGGAVNLGGEFTNTNIGSIVRLSGPVNLTGFLINNVLNLDAATGSWNLNGGGVIGGTVRTSAGSRLILTNDGAFAAFGILQGVTLQTGSNGIQYTDGAGLEVHSGRTLSQTTLDLSGGVAGNSGALRFTDLVPQALGGVGDVTFGTGGSSNSYINNLAVGATSRVTIGPGILIHGQNGRIDGQTSGFLNQGTIHLDVPGGLTPVTTVTNAGSIVIDANTTLSYQSPTLVQLPTGSMVVNGLLTAGSNGVQLAGLVGGGGTISASTTASQSITLTGTVSPGNNAIGTLSLIGNVAFGTGAHYTAETAGLSSADLLAITGNLDLGAVGEVLDMPSTVPTSGTYVIATYTGTRTGVFDVVSSPLYSVTYDDLNKRIVATSVPEPAGACVVLTLGTLGLLRRRRSKSRFGYVACSDVSS